MKIGLLIYTYNRTDDARINMEIVRNLWSKNELFKNVVIVHSYNGEKDWWQEKYLEDELLRLDNPGHFAGAELLLNEGIKCFSQKYPDVDYVITLASDTWLIKPDYIEKVLTTMQKEGKYLATCAWGTKEKNNIWNIGMALDFNIIDLKWAVKYGFFPLRFTEFAEKYSEIFNYEDKLVFLERVFALRFKQAIVKSTKMPSEFLLRQYAEKHLYRMTEREPIHIVRKLFIKTKQRRKMYWPDLGILGQHEPEPKQAILKDLDVKIGKNADRLITSTDLSYYNKGIKKTEYGD